MEKQTWNGNFKVWGKKKEKKRELKKPRKIKQGNEENCSPGLMLFPKL